MTTSSIDARSVFEIRPKLAFSKDFLHKTLKDVDTALFFAKVYKLDAQHTGALLRELFPSDPIIGMLTDGDHSTELQDGDYYPDYDLDPVEVTEVHGIKVDPNRIPDSVVLEQLWKLQEVTIATSIQDVADRLGSVLGGMPSDQGRMMFGQLAQFNARRSTMVDYRARVHHPLTGKKKKVLVILDDSGSMSQETIKTIVHDVVALSYQANATLAQVSNSCRVHAPGTYTVEDVLAAAEYGGTNYATLAPLLDEDWDEVITIADYDSYQRCKTQLSQRKGKIGVVTDVSLVERTTYLSEVVGTRAKEVRPILIAPNRVV